MCEATNINSTKNSKKKIRCSKDEQDGNINIKHRNEKMIVLPYPEKEETMKSDSDGHQAPIDALIDTC